MKPIDYPSQTEPSKTAQTVNNYWSLKPGQLLTALTTTSNVSDKMRLMAELRNMD